MIDKIIEISVKQRFLVILGLLGAMVWGIISYFQIPIDAFPDVTNVQVQILTPASGLSPLEVEKLVTYPIEIEMSSIPGLIENRSVSQFGLSAITLVFEDDVDIYWARQQIFEKLSQVREQLPENAEPEMAPVSTGLGEIFQYTVESDSLSPIELREIQDWIITPALRSVKGVVEINTYGGFVKQYHILLNADLMQNFDVTLDDIWSAVQSNNQNAGGNYIVRNNEQYIVRGIGMIETISDIEDIVVKAKNGIPVLIRDVGKVEVKPQIRYGAASIDGKGETVLGIVMMLKGESGRDVVKRIKQTLEELKPSLPENLKIVPFYDRTDLVKKAISTVTNALMMGGFLVLIILIVFLGNFRSSLIVALVLPASILISFIIMKQIGLSANLMSLGGLAIGIGMMVDGAIVVVENVVRRLREHDFENNREAFLTNVVESAREVGRPSVFAVFIVVTVFLPLFSLQGLEGKMFTPMAITISISLLISLLLAITVAPAICSFLLRSGMRQRRNPILNLARKGYLPLLDLALKFSGRTLLISGILCALALFLFTRLGTEFVPELEEGAIAIEALTLPTISIDNSVEFYRLVEKKILQTPEVVTVASRIGRAELATDQALTGNADIMIMLKPFDEWRDGYDKEMVVEEIRDNLLTIPGFVVSMSQPIELRVDELISGAKTQLVLKVYGEEMDKLLQLAEHMADKLGSMEGARDVKVQQYSGFGYLQIHINRDAISRYGLSIEEINEYIRIAVGGEAVSTLIEGDRRFDIVIRYAEKFRRDIDAVSNLMVVTPAGARLPLSTFADVYIEEGPSQIARENGRRKVNIELNIAGVDIGSFVKNARQEISRIKLPTGYFVKWGGQFENQQRANRRLMIILPITLFLIFVLLFLMFGSLKESILILLNLPFSLIGGVLLLSILGLYLSVPASVGFIAVMGTAVQNGIVMVSFIHEHRRPGQSVIESVRQGALLRVRPILMTSLTTILGLIPLLLAGGIGSEIQRPLAAVVVGGLMTSTISTLVILPLLYSRIYAKANVK